MGTSVCTLTFKMGFLIITGALLFLIGGSKAEVPANCSTGCWASRGECFWEEPTDPGLQPYWPYKCQLGEQGVDPEICYCGRCWGCKEDTAKCPNGKCSLRSPGPNFKPNGEFCNENENCCVGRRWISTRVKMSLTRNANMTLEGSATMGPILSTLIQLDTSVTPLTNANVTRSPALMTDIVAWSMEASAMSPDPLRTIMTPDTCATK